MDIVHHAAIGGIGLLALAAQDQELAGLGFLAGSVFPDLDVIFMAAGKRFYLKNHQGPSYSLPLAPFYAALLAAPVAALTGWDWTLFAGILAGLGLHVLLDLCNTFGIRMLWPLSTRRFCFDAVFFIDTVAWVMTLGCLAAQLGGILPADRAALIYALGFSAYFCAKFYLQRATRRRLGVDFAIPSAFNPFAFLVFSRRNGRLQTALYDALRARLAGQRELPEAAPEALALARNSAVFRDLQAILRGLQITAVDHDAAGTRITAQDLVVRNFGGKFGHTELSFDQHGELIAETAQI